MTLKLATERGATRRPSSRPRPLRRARRVRRLEPWRPAPARTPFRRPDFGRAPVRVPAPSLSTGVRAGLPLARIGTGVGLALVAVDLADRLLKGRTATPSPSFADPSVWRFRHGPNRYAANPDYAPGQPRVQSNGTAFISAGSGPETGIITAQALLERWPLGAPARSFDTRVAYWAPNLRNPERFAQTHAWEKLGAPLLASDPLRADIAAASGALGTEVRTISMPLPNPNPLRALPSHPAPNISIGTPTLSPVEALAEAVLEAASQTPDTATSFEFVEWQAIEIVTGGPAGGGRPIRRPPVEPHSRQPPRKGTKEKKVISRGRALGIALFNALDAVSENAEVIGAIYESLPKEVQQDNPCKRGDFGVDKGGQYGIDNADCKLRVIYDNWQLIDGTRAWKNIAKNLLADMIHGVKQRFTPVNIGQAVKQGDLVFAKNLDAALDKVFGP